MLPQTRIRTTLAALAVTALAAVGVGGPAGPDAPAAASEQVAMIPQPEVTDEQPGAWQPDAATRILVTSDELTAEAQRFAEEFAALQLTPAAPEVAFVTPENLPKLDDATADVVLELGDGPALQAASDGGDLTITGTNAEELFRASRPALQQLTASGSIPASSYRFDLPPEQVRSVHIDIARKHYPIEQLEALLYQLSWFGFNELELHFSENEGFAIESTTHPEIASPDAHSQAEIRELVALANNLHIAVSPSLDMPGHLDYALEQHPELRLRNASGGEVFGALDITSDAGLAFAHDLIGEYTELFAQPDLPRPAHWNLGADEFVDFSDAAEVTALTQAAEAKFGAGATASDALTDFVNTTAAIVREAGFAPRVWSDGMLHSSAVKLDTGVQVAHWTVRPADAVPADEFVTQGYEVLNVNDEFLYFVLGERVEYFYPTGEAILNGWDPTIFASGIPPSRDFDGTGLSVQPVAWTSGGMFAIWSDVPEALTPEEVVQRVRAPIAAMAVKFADARSELAFSELESQLASIADAPVVEAPAEVAPLPTLEPAPDAPAATDRGDAAPAPAADAAAADSDRYGWVLPAAIAAAAVVVAGVAAAMLLARSRRTSRERDGARH